MTDALFPDVRGLHKIPTPTPFPVGPANLYLYESDALYLIDTGTNTPEAWEAFLVGMKKLGRDPRDIEKIILTHHHLDHIGLSRKIKDLSGAVIYANPVVLQQIPLFFQEEFTRANLGEVLFELGVPAGLNARLCDERHNFRRYLDDFTVDKLLEDGGFVGPFRAFFRPGHSVSDTVLVHDKEKWAFTGDHLIHKITSNPLLRRKNEAGEREKSLIQYRESLLKTKELPITWCFAGHNTPFTDHAKNIERTLEHLESRSRKILALFNGGSATPFELTQRLFPHLSDAYLYYCLSATTGHLELLEAQGRTVHDRRGGILRYYAGGLPEK